MSAERWSEQPLKAIPEDADEILVIDPSEPAVQKRATLISVIANVSSPSKLLRVSNEADLVAEFGTTLQIPDGESWTVLALESFAMTRTFTIGDGASLQFRGATINLKITTTAFPIVFKNTNPANPISLLNIGNIEFVGDGTNTLFDIVASFSVIIERSVLFTNFKDAGTIETSFFDFEFAALQGVDIGLIIKNPFGGALRGFSLNQGPSSPPVTLVSIITNVASQVTIQDNFTNDTNSKMVWIDPNAPADAKFTVEGALGTPAEMFAQGTGDVAIASVANNGAGNTEFTAGAAHGLEVGQPVVLSAFAGQATYNGTFIVTAISGLTFDCEITFVATDTGNLNAASLDQTDVKVTGTNNVDTRNSMTQAEARTGATLTVDGSGQVDVPIEDLIPAPGDWIVDSNTEEFTIDTSTGLITYNGIEDKTFRIEYQLTATPTSGPSQVIDFDVHVNGIIQTKATTTIDTASVTKTTYIGGLFVLSNGDTVQLFKDNLTNNNDTDVSVATVLVTSAS